MKRFKLSPTSRRQWLIRLANLDQLRHLALLGAIAGALSALVIVAFRLCVEGIQAAFLPGADPENYEALAWWWHLLLPVAGGLLIGLLFQAVPPHRRQVGVVHVMERLAYHQGRLPAVNAVMQFLGAALAIIAGHSVGREGPAIHMGAAAGAGLGQWLHLPNNSVRTLVACGVAAAIAASFNTPLAGVIFSMEVVLMEYTITGFVPVIAAAVIATLISYAVFGSDPVFATPSLPTISPMDLPFVVITGIVAGCLAALFIQSLAFFSTVAQTRPLWQRTTAAGVLVGLCAVWTPQVMGIGYDTVNAALVAETGLLLLVAVTLMKIIATTGTLGLGIPGGLIGPTLVIGATAGAAIGLVATAMSPDHASPTALYAMIGMGAMMGATLQAPLAALTALLELTANPAIILPGMLAIVGACLISSQLFGKTSVFQMLMTARGLDYRDHPLAQSLRRISVARAMDANVVACDIQISRSHAQQLVAQHPHWLLLRPDDATAWLLPSVDLAHFLSANSAETIDLMDIPAQRRSALPVELRDSLQEVWTHLEHSPADMVYVTLNRTQAGGPVFGVLSRQDLEKHYRAAHAP